ncbi:hypothetical protein A4H97_32060 [Niastella yeongjuensis]|uniref:Uncharacterized protein n=1 Tax=Niastella yeongjuensis TaxID=354355 RepID=A0A1V9EIB4_9BACT|nr:hypothetical protein A4H97_32060 [Niastella yeongjuensis]
MCLGVVKDKVKNKSYGAVAASQGRCMNLFGICSDFSKENTLFSSGKAKEIPNKTWCRSSTDPKKL